MDTSKTIQHHPDAIVKPLDLTLILQVESVITALSMFCALGDHLAQPLSPWGTV